MNEPLTNILSIVSLDDNMWYSLQKSVHLLPKWVFSCDTIAVEVGIEGSSKPFGEKFWILSLNCAYLNLWNGVVWWHWRNRPSWGRFEWLLSTPTTNCRREEKKFWTQQHEISFRHGPNCFLSLSIWLGYPTQLMKLPRRHRNQPFFTAHPVYFHSFGMPVNRPDEEDACTIAGELILCLYCDAVLIGSLSQPYLLRIRLVLVFFQSIQFHSVRRQGHHGRPQSLNNPPTTSLDPTGCGNMWVT